MKSLPGNPPENQLPTAVPADALVKAVEASGYPLQRIAGDLLRTRFRVQDEWGFVDRDSSALRSLDLHAEMDLFDWNAGHPKARPGVSLLIECKKSELPFVFFQCAAPDFSLEFPVVTGLHHTTIAIKSDDSNSTWSWPITLALGLNSHPFTRAPTYASTFSQAERKGSGFILSGSNPYNGLILPLAKATEYFSIKSSPVKTALYFDVVLAFAIGVIDAPMVAVTPTPSGPDLQMVPWVRMERHEATEGETPWDRDRKFTIDIVHVNYLEEYVANHLMPYCEAFAAKCLAVPSVLTSGEGFVSGMRADSRTNLGDRIRPR